MANVEDFPPLSSSNVSFGQQSTLESYKMVLKENLNQTKASGSKQRKDTSETKPKPLKEETIEWPDLDGFCSIPSPTLRKKDDDKIQRTLFPQPSNKDRLSIGVKKFEPFKYMDQRQDELYRHLERIYSENDRYKEFMENFVPACRSYYWNEIPGIVFFEIIAKSFGSASFDKSDIFYRLAAHFPDVDKQQEIMSYIQDHDDIRVDPKNAIASSCKRCLQVFMNEDMKEHGCRKKGGKKLI
ncbi:hypothetical protein BLA29_007192 [Euroglyphus maynei]|uniref:Uncharacterized protein n=1 Tax=Euroglyphus maynei TaxID=6958 RepID=A0A1Y3BBF1_EURMA|nr:hypothetical protein BLA29_007192 [Euroglyphus maynei]